MSPFRSVGARLAFALLIVVAGVLAIVYLIVVPSYRSSLEANELRALERSLRTTRSRTIPSEPYLKQQFTEAWAPKVNARIVVFDLQNTVPALLEPVADSASETDSSDVENDPVAFEAIQGLTLARGTVSRGGQTYAEVAYPLGGSVVLLSASMHDQLQVVSVVRRRVFIAGAMAMVFAVLLGLRGRQRLRAADPPARARRRPDRRGHASTSRSSTTAPTRSASSPAPSSGCACGWRASTGPGASSSPTPRTSCAPPSSRSAASWSCWTTPGSTRARATSSSRRCASRSTAWRSSRPTCSTSPGSTRAGWRSPRSRSTSASSPTTWAAEFRARAATVAHPLDVAREDGVVALGDTERARQIGRILVENALVHTPPGTTVRVSSALDGSRATLTVANDGPGIPRDAQQQIFERFYRLDGGRASGSGLGLAIARELAEVMGGRIELDSQNGWTLFTLVLSADADVGALVAAE